MNNGNNYTGQYKNAVWQKLNVNLSNITVWKSYF